MHLGKDGVVLRIGEDESFAFGEGMGDFSGGVIGQMVANGLVTDHRHLVHVSFNNFIINSSILSHHYPN